MYDSSYKNEMVFKKFNQLLFLKQSLYPKISIYLTVGCRVAGQCRLSILCGDICLKSGINDEFNRARSTC